MAIFEKSPAGRGSASKRSRLLPAGLFHTVIQDSTPQSSCTEACRLLLSFAERTFLSSKL